jgi:hypothetical protein
VVDHKQGWCTPSGDGNVMKLITHDDKGHSLGELENQLEETIPQGKGIFDRDFGLALETL